MNGATELWLSRELRKAEATIKALQEQVDTLSAERNRLLQQTAAAIDRAETAERLLEGEDQDI